MDNIAKALIMAAGILMTVMVLSLASYLMVSFGNDAARLQEENMEVQIGKFNGQFTSYLENKKINIYDVIYLTNIANDNNIANGYKTRKTSADEGKYKDAHDAYVYVLLDGKYITYGKDNTGMDEKYLNLIQKDLTEIKKVGGAVQELPTYKITIQKDDVTRRVKKITFTKKAIDSI